MKNNPETLKRYRKLYYAKPEVIEHRKQYMAKWRNSEEKKEYIRKYARERARKIRELVLQAYGGKCSECSEARFPCLEIDHINNDGAQHRREMKINGGSNALTYWLYRNKYPEGFRILCGNCHRMKHYRRWELTNHA